MPARTRTSDVQDDVRLELVIDHEGDPHARTRVPGAPDLDVRRVLEGAAAAVPEVLLRTRVVCDVEGTRPVDGARLGAIVRTLLHLEAELPSATQVWVTATEVEGGVLVTVEDDQVAGAGGAGPRGGQDVLSNSLLLARATAMARRGGGRLWLEDGVDGGLVYALLLPAVSARD